jgi:hypothetical protein
MQMQYQFEACVLFAIWTISRKALLFHVIFALRCERAGRTIFYQIPFPNEYSQKTRPPAAVKIRKNAIATYG